MPLSAYALLLLLAMAAAAAGNVPSDYGVFNDSRCDSFIAEDQGSCNACAAAAVASSLGLRACLHGGRNVRYSSQQMWDCYRGKCEDSGVDMDSFMFSVIYGIRARFMLLISATRVPQRILPSNYTSCSQANSSERVESVSQHKESWLEDRNNSSSVKLMQNEIMTDGPIIAILFLTPSEFLGFSQWINKQGDEILRVSPPMAGEQRSKHHAVTVFGWGTEARTGIFYWKILNSFGTQWGRNGTANIAGNFALMGREWYSVSSLEPKMKTKEAAKTEEDVMIADVRRLPIITKKKLQYKERSGIKDASVLGIVIGGMLVASFVICTVDKKKRTL